MTSLIVKDLLVNKKYLGPAVLYGIFILYVFQNFPGGQFAAATVGIGYILMMNATAHEDKNNFEIILNSLPIPRRKIVMAKYLSIFVYVAFALLSYGLGLWVINVFHLSVRVNPLSILNVSGAIFTLCLMSGLYYPIYFKWGFLKSNVIKTVVFLTFFFAPGLIIGSLQSQPKNLFLHTLINLVNSLSEIQLSVLLFLITLVFLSLSLSLSLWFYERREF